MLSLACRYVATTEEEKSAAAALLEEAIAAWPVADRCAKESLEDWQHRLRSLIQAGVPMVSPWATVVADKCGT